jgi:heptosyltransferase-1
MTSPPRPRRILLIRLSAIGDVVMATPLIRTLRRTYPDAYLAWMVESGAAGLLRNNSDLDEVMVLPRSEWRALLGARRYAAWLGAIRRFITTLRQRRFDLVIDLQGLLKSAVWARLSGAPTRIGLDSREASHLLMTRVIREDPSGRRAEGVKTKASKRIGSEYLHLARELGLVVDDFQMNIAIGQADETWARSWAERTGPYAVFCPFTTRPQKHWLEERWIELGEVARTRLGLAPVLLGGPGDRAAAERMQTQNPLLANEVGVLSLARSAALIKHAACLVGVDTGLTHMGIAFGIPTVALFGSTRPYLDTTRANARVLYEPLDCSPCRRHPTCGGQFTCMRLLEVEGVTKVLESLLSRGVS